jgi:hypothetical protein
MRKMGTAVITVVCGLKMFEIGSAHAQRVPASDMSTGEGGPIQADQYGPSLRRYWSPIRVANHRFRTNRSDVVCLPVPVIMVPGTVQSRVATNRDVHSQFNATDAVESCIPNAAP